jgi:hypothetical protein
MRGETDTVILGTCPGPPVYGDWLRTPHDMRLRPSEVTVAVDNAGNRYFKHSCQDHGGLVMKACSLVEADTLIDAGCPIQNLDKPDEA